MESMAKAQATLVQTDSSPQQHPIGGAWRMGKWIKPNYLSYICLAISSSSWVTGFVYFNDHNVHRIETSMLRGFMIMVVSAAICVYTKQPLDLRVSSGVALKRNIIFTAQSYVMSAIQFYLPLGVVHTLATIGPISVSLYQYYFQSKKQSLKQIFGIGLTVIGVILTANGRLISSFLDPSYVFDTKFTNYYTDDPAVIAIASLLFVLFLVIWGYAIYSTNKMKASPFVVNFLLGAKIYMVSSLLFPYILPTKVDPVAQTQTGGQIDQSVFYWGMLNSVLFGVAQTFFILGIVLSENIGMTIMLGSLTVLIAYGVSILRYNQEINVFCMAGSLFLVFGLSRIVFSD